MGDQLDRHPCASNEQRQTHRTSPPAIYPIDEPPETVRSPQHAVGDSNHRQSLGAKVVHGFLGFQRQFGVVGKLHGVGGVDVVGEFDALFKSCLSFFQIMQ